MTTLEKILAALMLAMLLAVGAVYWTGSEDSPGQDRVIGAEAAKPGAISATATGGERLAGIESSSRRDDRRPASSDAAVRGSETGTSAPVRRDPEGFRQDRYDTDASRSTGHRGSDRQIAEAPGPVGRESGESTTTPVEQHPIDSSGEDESTGVAPDRPAPRDSDQAPAGPSDGTQQDYYCDLARSIREACEAMPRDDAGYERCLSFGGYYTSSRHCGYRP